MDFKKNINRWLSIILFGFILFMFGFQQSYAKDYSEHEVVLEKFGSILYSDVIFEEEFFNSVIIQADNEIEGLMVNFDPLNGGFWKEADIHDDGFGYDTILFTSPVKSVQFKQIGGFDSAKIVLNVNLVFVEKDLISSANTENLYSGPLVASSGVRIIKRNEWGADENLRFWNPELEELFKSNGQEKDYSDVCGDFNIKYKDEVKLSRTVKYSPSGDHLIWPLSYPKKVSKFVIHHTDSELRDLTGDKRMDGRDYRAMLRAIYYYHAVTRGWGDIGYNYIIDPLGNIYEGRYGGSKVIGAHARCYNNGSVGISIIGNYETRNISEPAMNSLIKLIAQKSVLYNIDPDGYSTFRGKMMPNIIGHRDVGATSCPGKKLYASFSRIRERSSLLIRSGLFSESTLSPVTLDYNADFISSVNTVSLDPNERGKVKLKFKNIGRKTWDRNTWLHVALNNRKEARVVPIISDKAFVASDMKENKVPPGQIATFEVEFEAGYYGAREVFELAPVVNGRYKLSKSAVFIPIQVSQPRFDYRVVSKKLPNGIVFQGQKVRGTITLENIGNVKWVNYGDNPIRMGTEALRDRRSLLVKKHATRIAHLIESEVLPGEKGTFLFDLYIPSNVEGRIKERFTPLIENVHWMDDRGLSFEINVREPTHAAKIISKSVIPKMLPGEMRKIELTMKNSGDLAWDQDNMYVSVVTKGIKSFKRRLTPLTSVNPSKTVDFNFWIQAPYKEGRHRILLRPRFDDKYVKGGWVRYLIDVEKPKLRAQLISQTSRFVSIKPREEKEIEVKFKNIGNAVWRNKGRNVIHLAPTKPQDRLSKIYYEDGWENKFRAATLEENEVKPGEIGTFKFKVKPNSKGIFREYFQLVIEHVGWIDGSFVRWDFSVFDRKTVTRSTRITTVSPKTTIVKPTVKTPAIVTNPNTVVISSDIFRVRISYEDNNSQITADKNYKVYDENNKLLFSMAALNSVKLRKVLNNIHMQVGNTTKTASVVRIVPDSGGVIKIITMERRPAWNLALNDNMFRGVMEVCVVGGTTAFINELPLEDYMKGLAEASNNTLTEKQKTIAILARTYARFYMDDDNRKFPGKSYDGSDDPAIFQRYLGYGLEIRSPNFVNAVNATKDVVVTYNGELVKTPYFNSDDGRTRSAEEVWGWKHTPYLQSVDDPYCKGFSMNGHGVGLSGCGAEGMAKDGKGYEEIIKYYYQDVKVEKLDF